MVDKPGTFGWATGKIMGGAGYGFIMDIASASSGP